jgi:aminoglycoside phosphotransferase (APT) family kinase protein
MSGVRAPYRDRLEVLAAGGVVEARLAAWAAQQSIEVLGLWRRVYGKLRPQRSPWAVLVYEAEGAPTVQVRLLEDSDGAGGLRGSLPAGELGRVEVVSCAADPRLPGLPAVLAALDHPKVVRYHPGSRCTVRGGTRESARYVKVLFDAVDDQQDARARWQASVSGALSFAVAEPHGWEARSRSSWYGVVPGVSVSQSLSGPEATTLARRIGEALGELASSSLRPSRRDDATVQLARAQRGLGRAAVAAPGLSVGLREAGESLARAHARLDARPLVPIHGAAHLGQWLVDDTGRLGLVDFDRFACGEPEFDLATFVVELRDLLKRQETGELEAAVVDGFRAVAGDVDAVRLELYVLHKQLAKVVRTASALRPDAEERAAPLLEALQSPLGRVGG